MRTAVREVPGVTENDQQPFSEDAALRELEELQQKIEASRVRRKEANGHSIDPALVRTAAGAAADDGASASAEAACPRRGSSGTRSFRCSGFAGCPCSPASAACAHPSRTASRRERAAGHSSGQD